MSKEVVIVGGGVIGLFSAYYLVREGHNVTIVDKGDFTEGCSYGNAGMIVPSHVIPLAAPGMISQGIKWMFNPRSPFYVKPRFRKELFNWGMKFYKSANKQHVEQSMPALRDLSLLSKKLYHEIASEHPELLYQEKGLLMLFQTEKVGEEETSAGKLAVDMGLEVDFLSKAEVSNLESGIDLNASGGVHYKSDAHLSPNNLMAFLKAELVAKNVKFVDNCHVIDGVKRGDALTKLITSKGDIDAEEVIIAGGAWSSELAKKLGIALSLLPGKGYSFTLDDPHVSPSIPSILCEGKVAVTPMGEQLRFGGTMEITHLKDTSVNRRRVEGIVNTINSFYPELNLTAPENEDIWMGYRPCSSDGLPFIGKLNGLKNVTVAAGHGMMGLSLAPATGKVVSQLLDNRIPDVEMRMFDPNR